MRARALSLHRYVEVDAELARCFPDTSGPCSLTMAGSTATTVLIRGTTMWCANIGDSTGILVKRGALTRVEAASRRFAKQSMIALKVRGHFFWLFLFFSVLIYL